jgi:citrate lyase subunit beta / citryl-CoA lyase
MDFISGHHGAIGAEALRNPGQFEHKLIVRAKTEICAAALANGLVPSHNITLDLQNQDTAYRDAIRARKEFGFLRHNGELYDRAYYRYYWELLQEARIPGDAEAAFFG